VAQCNRGASPPRNASRSTWPNFPSHWTNHGARTTFNYTGIPSETMESRCSIYCASLCNVTIPAARLQVNYPSHPSRPQRRSNSSWKFSRRTCLSAPANVRILLAMLRRRRCCRIDSGPIEARVYYDQGAARQESRRLGREALTT